MLYRTKGSAVTANPKDVPASKEDAEAPHVHGPAKAPITFEEFADFQCPPCAALSEPINQMEHDYQSQLRVIFRNFPLAVHAHALEAAYAAEAAALQGKFWEMHDVLYREQSSWAKAPDVGVLFTSYAGVIGLDLGR